MLEKRDKNCCSSHFGPLNVNVFVLVNVNAHENVRFFAVAMLSPAFTWDFAPLSWGPLGGEDAPFKEPKLARYREIVVPLASPRVKAEEMIRGREASQMTARAHPASSARRAHCTLGIIPPVMTPSLMSCSISE